MAVSAGASKRAAYHHGDLRTALVAAAEDLLAEKGPEAFTLRECARRVGVSNAAPAHHFKDVATLLSEVAAVGFERLTAAMSAARAEAGSDPAGRLLATGRAYVQTAVAHPATFHLMFHSQRCDRNHPRLRAAGAGAYRVLNEAVRALAKDTDVLPAVHLAWSTVHGFATLQIEGRLGGDPRFGEAAQWPRHLDAMLELLLGGLGSPRPAVTADARTRP